MKVVHITTRQLAKLVFEAEASPWGLLLCGDCTTPVQVKAVADDRKAVPSEYNFSHENSDFVWGEEFGEFKKSPVFFADPSKFILRGQYNVRMLAIRCRKCPNCVTARSRMWSMRAMHESDQSARTWLTTLTVSPEYRLQLRINSRRATGGEEFSGLAAALGKWFTLYLKRVRKETGVKLRFLSAFEAHKDGFPHLHALIHEQDMPVRKECLNRQWPWGFSHHKLVDSNASRYVTKYISKEMHNRVRASLHYGSHVNTAYSPQGCNLQSDKLNKRLLAENKMPPYPSLIEELNSYRDRDCTYAKISSENENEG